MRSPLRAGALPAAMHRSGALPAMHPASRGPTATCARRLWLCREREGAEPNPRDPWATREFYIKWARRSYLHCTWELKSELSQVSGGVWESQFNQQ